jgi:energy-coupling factor transport system ATP-binding protein
MKPFIDIQHVTYTYPAQAPSSEKLAPVLSDMNVQISSGEYVVILGHNGSGKSTLARLCNALLIPTEGQVFVDGLDTRDETQHRTLRDNVGMIFQNPDNQIIATIVEDDIAWSLSVRGYSRSEIRKRVDVAMEAVGISSLRQLPPQQLSGGQRQRVAIASVLALRPRCIIADEVTSMLDPLSRREIVALLHSLNSEQNITIVQVTHLLEEAALAQRVLVLDQGSIVLDGTPAHVFANLNELRALKLAIPEPIELAARLRQVGYPLSSHALTVEAIAGELHP